MRYTNKEILEFISVFTQARNELAMGMIHSIDLVVNKTDPVLEVKARLKPPKQKDENTSRVG